MVIDCRSGRLVQHLVWTEFRSVLELLLGDADLIAAKLFIVCQQRPWDRIMMCTNSQETAEAQTAIIHFSGTLLDHEPLDLPDALAVRSKDGGSFDPVARDEGRSFLILQGHVVSPFIYGGRADPLATTVRYQH